MIEVSLICSNCGLTFDWELPDVGLYAAAKLKDSLPARCTHCREIRMYKVELPRDA